MKIAVGKRTTPRFPDMSNTGGVCVRLCDLSRLEKSTDVLLAFRCFPSKHDASGKLVADALLVLFSPLSQNCSLHTHKMRNTFPDFFKIIILALVSVGNKAGRGRGGGMDRHAMQFFKRKNNHSFTLRSMNQKIKLKTKKILNFFIFQICKFRF